MNFDELYEKYRNNTATEEEKAYVEAEIAKAKKLAAIIDEVDTRHAIEPCEKETVKSSVKTFLKKTKLRVAAIVLGIVLLLGALSVGGYFTAAAIIASNNAALDRDEAIELAKKKVSEIDGTVNAGEVTLGEVDRELVLSGGISRARYEYEIEIRVHKNGIVKEYDLLVNAKDSSVVIEDID